MSSWVLPALFMVLLNITTNNLTNARHTWYEKPNEFCYADTEHPYLYFSSKTAYDAVYYKSDAETIPSECKPRQIWMLIRHGTRYPLKKKMEAFQELTRIRDEIVKNHEQNKGSLCNKDIENLKKWTFEKIPLSQSDQLTKQGYDDLRTIGDRTWWRFHELFKHSYSKKHYTVQYTRHVKTKDSAEAFSRGLFGKHIHIDPPKDDDLLQQIYPQCKVLPLPGADDPPDAGRKERSLFKEGPLVHEVIRNVSRRLGFDKPLSADDVDNMYDMCRYKKSWKFDELSPWCACFLNKEFQVLEYVGDLSYYYNSGHGYSANLRTGCPLVQDMIFRFRDIATNPYTEEPFGVFYFGHSTTIYNLVARLGILKDPVRLTHENFYNVTNKKWHTSSIAPFSGNFAAVMLKCHTGSENRVVFFHHERPFKFNGCQGYVCSWDMLENMYKNITDSSTCNYDFCSKDDETTESEIEKSTTQTTKIDEVDEKTTTSYINSPTTTTERSNGIVQGRYDNYNLERSRNRVLHRKVTQVVSVQEISKESIVNDPEPMISRETHFNDDTEDLEAPYGTYKPKTKWTNKEIRLSWLFISFFVCVVILVICNRYSNKKKQLKMLRAGYDRMSNIHLRDIQDKF